jgi:hypothetical protein
MPDRAVISYTAGDDEEPTVVRPAHRHLWFCVCLPGTGSVGRSICAFAERGLRFRACECFIIIGLLSASHTLTNVDVYANVCVCVGVGMQGYSNPCFNASVLPTAFYEKMHNKHYVRMALHAYINMCTCEERLVWVLMRPPCVSYVCVWWLSGCSSFPFLSLLYVCLIKSMYVILCLCICPYLSVTACVCDFYGLCWCLCT